MSPATLALIAANLVPVFGVLHLGWEILPLVLLYWLETLVVLVYAIARIMLAHVNYQYFFLLNLVHAVYLLVLFTVLATAYGALVLHTFGAKMPWELLLSNFWTAPVKVAMYAVDVTARYSLGWSVLALFVSHGVSFWTRYVRPRAYADTSPAKLVNGPFKGLIVMQLVAFLGGMGAQAIGTPLTALLALIALKTAADLFTDRAEASRSSSQGAAVVPAARVVGKP